MTLWLCSITILFINISYIYKVFVLNNLEIRQLIILWNIVTGTSSRDSLLSWIRLLEKHNNPILANIPVIFTLVAPPSDVSLFDAQQDSNEKKEENIAPKN